MRNKWKKKNEPLVECWAHRRGTMWPDEWLNWTLRKRRRRNALRKRKRWVRLDLVVLLMKKVRINQPNKNEEPTHAFNGANEWRVGRKNLSIDMLGCQLYWVELQQVHEVESPNLAHFHILTTYSPSLFFIFICLTEKISKFCLTYWKLKLLEHAYY